jgi:hypothetical protein
MSVIVHVDCGKSTLTDSLMASCCLYHCTRICGGYVVGYVIVLKAFVSKQKLCFGGLCLRLEKQRRTEHMIYQPYINNYDW